MPQVFGCLIVWTSRRYLLDLGSSTFDTSLKFFSERYGQVSKRAASAAGGHMLTRASSERPARVQAGVLFDEIWAWEMATYDPT